MRFHFTLATALILAGPALASSIETVGVVTSAGSIIVKSCAHCPAPKPVAHRDSYIVPALRTGTQTVQLKDINGEKKVVRTEAWMGGSPVVYISAPPKDDTANAVCVPLHSGRRTIVLQTTITRNDGKVAAIVIQTQIIVDKAGT